MALLGLIVSFFVKLITKYSIKTSWVLLNALVVPDKFWREIFPLGRGARKSQRQYIAYVTHTGSFIVQ